MRSRNLVYAGLLVACGVLLPQIFHIVGGSGLGGIFLPMHIPVLIAGYVLNPATALIVGILTPICSFLYTGGNMPAVPMLYFMILELGVYGLAISVLFNKFKLGVFPSLLCSMILGRCVRGLVYLFITKVISISLPPIFGIATAIVQGVPGIIVQLIIIPPIIIIIKKQGWLNSEKIRA